MQGLSQQSSMRQETSFLQIATCAGHLFISLVSDMTCMDTPQGTIRQEEWKFLLTGGLGDADAGPNPESSWLSERAWKDLARVCKLPGFPDAPRSIKQQPEAWKKMHESNTPYEEALPGIFTGLSDFQKMLIVRCLRWVTCPCIKHAWWGSLVWCSGYGRPGDHAVCSVVSVSCSLIGRSANADSFGACCARLWSDGRIPMWLDRQ